MFAIPALLVLRDRPRPQSDASLLQAVRQSFSDVADTVRGLRRNLTLAFFLLSFLFYNDGIQTIISQASTFALHELAFSESSLMGVILMIQFVALPGAILVGWCSDWFGRKRTLVGCLAVWASVLVFALFINTQSEFWLLAIAIAIVLGGTQSVSRSLMATMIPRGESAQYFGLFNFSGKATSFMGTFLFGAIVAVTDSSRAAIFGLLPLFLIGGLLLWKVTEKGDKSIECESP